MAAEADVDALAVDVTLSRTCLVCGSFFTHEGSLARQQCARHPGVFQAHVAVYGTDIDTFSCCGRAGRGCLACDHVTEPGLPVDLVMPLARARALFGDDVATARRVRVHADGRTLTLYRSAAASML